LAVSAAKCARSASSSSLKLFNVTWLIALSPWSSA
jgi:hypothetical protein